MNLRRIHPKTCPLCRRRALTLQADECHCAACKSVFVFDRETKLCRYTVVTPRFAHHFSEIEVTLTSQWLTRQQVFALAAPFAPKSSAFNIPTANASLKLSPRFFGALWMGGLGVVTLAVIVCGAVFLLWLGSQIGARQQMNVPTTTVGLTRPTIFVAVLASPSPRPTTNIEPTSAILWADLPTPALPVGTLKPLPTFAPPRTPTPAAWAGVLVSPVNAPVATLPPTFTPRPLILTNLATPVVAVAPTSSVINAAASPIQPSPTPTAGESAGLIVITTLNFQGDASLKEADEYVELQNLSAQGISLKGWSIGLKGGERLSLSVLGNGFLLPPNQKCRIYTNSPPLTGGCGPLSFNRNTELWPNSGGVVELYDQNEKRVSEYSYLK